MRELEIRHLALRLLSVDSVLTMTSLNATIERYTNGELPHAKHIISALYELMESDELPIEEIPLPVALSSDEQAHSGDWDGLKKALTSSLTSGTFLDSRFYAAGSRSSPTGLPKIHPIYFCSMADDSFTSKLMSCKPFAQITCGWAIDPIVSGSSKLKPQKASVISLDGYDSDIENEEPDQEDSKGCYPHSKWFADPFSINH